MLNDLFLLIDIYLRNVETVSRSTMLFNYLLFIAIVLLCKQTNNQSINQILFT